jgi:hypothetical protein
MSTQPPMPKRSVRAIHIQMKADEGSKHSKKALAMVALETTKTHWGVVVGQRHPDAAIVNTCTQMRKE